jgi:PAS domain S-box-containing protein
MEKKAENKFKILVVDNTPDSLNNSVRVLNKAGYRVSIAATGEECMEIIKQTKPDILLLDVILPDTTGKDLFKKIKDIDGLSSIYIILLSDLKVSSDIVSEGLEEGADGYLRKPVSGRELLARIKAACRLITAENKTKANSILLEACINSPQDMIVLAIDKKYNYLAFNKYHKEVMLRAYGCEVKPGMNLIKCITNKEDTIKSKKNYDKALKGVSHITIEEYGDLNRQFYETRYSPIYNEEGDVAGCTAFSSNVTERIMMEKSLRKSEEKFRKAFITTPDAININRLYDGMYISVNEGFSKISGYSEKEIIGRTSIDLDIWVNSSDREKLVKGLKTNGTVNNLQTMFRMKDGSIRDGIISASLIDLDGVPHILSVTRDITERKLVEEALYKSNKLYDNLVSKIPVGIYILHTKQEGTFTLDYVSPIMAEMLNMNVEELIADAKSIYKNIHPDDLDSFIKLNQEGIQNHRPFNWKGRILDNERIKWLQISSTPELQENGDVLWHGIIVDITERKLAEDALHDSEENMRFIVKHDPNAIAVFDLRLNYIAVSDRYLQDYEVREEDIIGKHHYDVFPEMPQKWKDVHQRCLAGATERNDDDCFDRPDGSITYNRWECVPWRRIGGEIGGIITYTEVTTDRKIAQEALKENERLLRESQSVARLGTFVWDIKTGLWKSSAILDSVFGIDEVYVRSFEGWSNIVHPAWREIMIDYVTNEVIVKHHEFDKEYQIIRQNDGQKRWVHGQAKLEFDEKKNPIKLLGTIRDITERKQAEEQIYKIGQHYQALIEKAPDGIILLDSSGNFKFASPAARKMFGYNISEPIPADPSELTHPDDLPMVLGELGRVFKDPAYIPTLQYRFADKIGNWIWVESTFSNLCADPSVESIVINFRNITDRKQAEDSLIERSRDLQYELEKKRKAEIELQESYKQLEISKIATFNLLEDIKTEMEQRKKVEVEINKLNNELEQRVNERTAQLEAANKELQAFAYSVSHDLRAPLRAIDGFSKFVLEDYGTKLDSEGKRLLGLIRSNTQKMDQLIVDILALSRVTRSEHKVSKVDMTKMAFSMFNEAVSSEKQKKISIIIDQLPVAHADPTYLKQVWINLISNAIKFSSLKEKPEITIGGYTESTFHVYYVKDNGVGFNPEYAHKLFGVFQRLHKVDEFEGTGVGLAIVQRIIYRHGGKVWAESIEGKGATFYFSIPVKPIGGDQR